MTTIISYSGDLYYLSLFLLLFLLFAVVSVVVVLVEVFLLVERVSLVLFVGV